jgi:hypothetical protein
MGDAYSSSDPPPWLDERLPRRLLELFLAKLEKGQKPTLRVSAKTAPELFHFQARDVSYLWSLVESLDKEFHILRVETQKPKPHQEVYVDARLFFNSEKEDLVRMWLNRPAFDPYAIVWRSELVKQADKFEDQGRALAENLIRVPEQGAERTLRGFAQIGTELQSPITLRALSARCFWGDSKFLDRREALIRSLFPSLVHNLIPRPVLLNVYLPEDFQHVLFVENQDTFVALTQHPPPGYVFVYSAGFRGSTARIRDPGNAVFSFLNVHPGTQTLNRFETWWFKQSALIQSEKDEIQSWFWGDLDYAGMNLLKALRLTFANIQAWPAGYEPLRKRLEQGEGHTADATSHKLKQKDPESTGCPYADAQLLPQLRETRQFVDQELVTLAELPNTGYDGLQK